MVSAFACRTVDVFLTVGRILHDALDITITVFFLVGQKFGFWQLPQTKSASKELRIQRRLYNAIMVSGIVITSALYVYGIYKVARWQGWIH